MVYAWIRVAFIELSLGLSLVPVTAATLTLVPSAADVNPGEMVTVDAIISGLTNPPSVGSFDIFLGYTAGLLAPTSVDFSSRLGDLALFEAITDVRFMPGVVNIAEVSLLTNDELDTLQAPSFSLASLHFTATGSGPVSFEYLGGLIDDANGDVLIGSKIPEPATLGLFGSAILLLLLGARFGKRKRNAILTSVLVVMTAAAARADSTAIVRAPRKADAKYPPVSTVCTLKVINMKGMPATGSLEMTCVFTNESAQAQKFIYCTMLGLKSKAGTTRDVTGGPNWDLEAVGDTYKCKEKGVAGTFRSGWHFGCKEVTVPAGNGMKSAPVVFKSTDSQSGSTKYTPPAGSGIRTLKADDFRINYSDTIKYSPTVTKYDPASCVIAGGGTDGKHKDLNAQDTFLVPRGPLAAYWLQSETDFKDPVFRYQPIIPATSVPCDFNRDGEVDINDVNAILSARGQSVSRSGPGDDDGDGMITANDARRCVPKVTKEYSPYDDAPCLPNAFPASPSDLSRCKLTNAPQLPNSGDINLFDAITMSASSGMQFPAFLDIEQSGTGLARLETIPPQFQPFNMPGGGELYGTIRPCSTASSTQCLPADQPTDGRFIDYDVNIRDMSTKELLFYQHGRFVQDPKPPQVTSHQVSFDSSRNLVAQVSATDAATSPIQAEIWFSTNGNDWDHLSLEALTSVLDEPSSQTFRGTVGPFAPGQTVRYFFGVQDVVGNVTWYGIGQATAP